MGNLAKDLSDQLSGDDLRHATNAQSSIETTIQSIIDTGLPIANSATEIIFENNTLTNGEKEKLTKIANEIVLQLPLEDLQDAGSTRDYLVDTIQVIIDDGVPSAPKFTRATQAFPVEGHGNFESAIINKAEQIIDEPLDANETAQPQRRQAARLVISDLSDIKAQLTQNGVESDSDNQISTINDLISGINEKFGFADRHQKTGGSKFFNSGQKQTVMTNQNGSLTLHNKIHPDSGKKIYLGKGQFGYGRWGEYQASDAQKPETVFVKKIRHNPETLPTDVDGKGQLENWKYHEQTKSFQSELDIMKSLSGHPNIVQVRDGFEALGSDGNPKFYMAMEMMSGDDVSKLLPSESGKSGKTLRMEARRLILKESIQGLKAMHDKGIVHRDIKPENIMLDKDFHAKLGDFGESRLMDDKGKVTTSVLAGTKGYIPEHLLSANPAPSAFIYDQSTDIYAMKVTVEKLIGSDEGDKFPGYNDFMSLMSRADTTTDDLLAHDFLKTIDNGVAKAQQKIFQSSQ